MSGDILNCPLKPKGRLSFKIVNEYGDGKPYGNLVYIVTDIEGKEHTGTLDANGNEAPRDYALTTKENLIWALPEPANVVQDIRLENMFDWAINTFADEVFIKAKFGGVSFKDWLKEQLALLEKWQWPKEEQALFMIEQRLDYEQRQSNAWQPLPEETPQQHYERVKLHFTKQLPRQPLCTTLDTTKL